MYQNRQKLPNQYVSSETVISAWICLVPTGRDNWSNERAPIVGKARFDIVGLAGTISTKMLKPEFLLIHQGRQRLGI